MPEFRSKHVWGALRAETPCTQADVPEESSGLESEVLVGANSGGGQMVLLGQF